MKAVQSLTERAVLALIRTELVAAAEEFDPGHVQIVRAQQRVVEGAVNGPAIYLTVLGRKRYGFAQQALVDTGSALQTTTIQNIELQLQLQASVPVFDHTPPAYSAQDLLEAAILYLDGADSIQRLLLQGVSLARIAQVDQTYWQNEGGQNEAVPVVVLEVKFATSRLQAQPQAARIEGGIYPY